MITDILNITTFQAGLFLSISWSITCLRSDPFTTVSCISIQIRKAWNFNIDSRFLIHRFECTKIAVLRFSIAALRLLFRSYAAQDFTGTVPYVHKVHLVC